MSRIRVSSASEDRRNAIREKLRSYRYLVAKHEACCDLFERLFPKMTSCVQADRVMSSGGNANEDKMATKLDLEAQMAESLQAMRDEINGILDLIHSLTGDESIILLRRYTMNERMDAIAEKLHYSERQCWRLHEGAIERLASVCQ